MGKERILVVEDECDIRELVRHNLVKEGYNLTCVSSGEDALTAAFASLPDLIILDIMLPGIDGLNVCRMLRQDARTREIPIMLLTAKTSDEDVVVGLEVGADDYITKPFSPKVLAARVRALLRRDRLPAPSGDSCINRCGIIIDSDKYTVEAGGVPIKLSATEFRLLSVLARNEGRVLTRDQLIDSVHGTDYAVTSRSVDVQVVGLRKKLGEQGGCIETVRGVGYRFREEV